jgi:hypothetical protein
MIHSDNGGCRLFESTMEKKYISFSCLKKLDS